MLSLLLFAMLLAAATASRATFHLISISEIYSNADGTVQYMVLAPFFDGQDLLAGHTILTNGPGGQQIFPFPSNLPSGVTRGKHILVATPGFAALNLVTPDYIVPNGFFPIANGTVNYGEGVSTWNYTALPTDGINALMSNGMSGPNIATNFAGATASVVPVAPAVNYQGLWWKPDESGWGVNFVHQGDRIFATWYTYDKAGNAYWLSMLADRLPGSNAYKGDIFADVGPPFNAFVGSGTPTKVGDGTVTFTDANNGSFFYEVTAGGATSVVQQTKPITRFSLGGPQPVCTYSASANLAAATNYQDLWWVPTESGWGANFAHQGDSLFATWYTYDAKVAGNNAPLWLSALMSRQGMTNVFSGPLLRTSGPRFDNYRASDVVQPPTNVGTATLSFVDGNNASFRYVTNGAGNLPAVDETKSITRFLFAPGGTPCQ